MQSGRSCHSVDRGFEASTLAEVPGLQVCHCHPAVKQWLLDHTRCHHSSLGCSLTSLLFQIYSQPRRVFPELLQHVVLHATCLFPTQQRESTEAVLVVSTVAVPGTSSGRSNSSSSCGLMLLDFPFPTADNVWVMMIVRRIRGKISELFFAVLCTKIVHSDMHTCMSSYYSWLLLSVYDFSWFRLFRFVFYVCFCYFVPVLFALIVLDLVSPGLR